MKMCRRHASMSLSMLKGFAKNVTTMHGGCGVFVHKVDREVFHLQNANMCLSTLMGFAIIAISVQCTCQPESQRSCP